MDTKLDFITEQSSTFARNVVSLLVLPSLAAVKLWPVFSPFGAEKYLSIWAYFSSLVRCSLPHGPSE